MKSNEKKKKNLERLFEKRNKHLRELGTLTAAKNKKAKSKKLASDIRRMRKTMTVKDIGDHIGIDEKSVYRILRKYPEKVTTERVTNPGDGVTNPNSQKGDQSRQKESERVTNPRPAKPYFFSDGVTDPGEKNSENVTDPGNRVTNPYNIIDPITRDVNPNINNKTYIRGSRVQYLYSDLWKYISHWDTINSWDRTEEDKHYL